MITRADRLREYIAAAKGAPVIGVDDCGPWVARWIERETKRSLGFPSYATRAAGHRLAADAGGLVALAEPLMRAISLFETSDPQIGDVGVVALSDRETAGIFCRAGIMALRGERFGVSFLRPRTHTLLKAWTIPECR